MQEKAKIRINLNSREIEIEGSEAFVEKYSETINNYIEIIKTPSRSNPQSLISSQREEGQSQFSSTERNADSVPDSFGEYYSRFPKSMKDVDKILVAGYFHQQKSGNNSFSTQEAASLLIEQGVKLSNAAAFLKANLTANKIFKHDGKFRISENGVDYIKKLGL